jgi:putative MATE family efflux protein
VSRTPDTEDTPEVASELLDLREKPPEPLAPSPQALGVWELAWPTIAAMLTQTLVRWADVKMVGSLGREAVAAVTGGGHVYWFLQTVVMAVTTGLVALLARAVGARDQRLADATLRQGIVLGTAFGVATMVAGFPLRFLAIEIYGVEETVVQYGATYLFWLLVGNVPFTLGFVFATGLRAAGDSRTPLVVGILANVLNVFLNWVLIYGNLGAPPLGVAGAGMASSLAMLFQLVVFWYLWGTSRLGLRPAGATFAPDVGLFRRILKVGYPATLEGALWHVGLVLFMRLMSRYGTAEFAAYNIGAQILALSFLPGVGFAVAASTLVGQHLGDQQPERAARSGWRSLAGGIVALSLNGVLIIAFAEPIASWFIDDAEVVALTVDFIWILGIAQPLMAVEFVMGGALRGAGDTRYPLGVVFVGLFLCRLIPATLAALAFQAPIQIVWSALLLDYATKATLLVRRFARGAWKEIEV